MLGDCRGHDVMWRQLKLRVSAQPLESLQALGKRISVEPIPNERQGEKAELGLQQDAEVRQKVAEAEMELGRRKREAGDTVFVKPGIKIKQKKR